MGYPTFTPNHPVKEVTIPYPCQERPCGCENSEQCWAGDCCCFTLEEKLAWAEANGVEPPEHVRPLVKSRQKQAPPPLKKKGCCCEAAAEDVASPACCIPQDTTTEVQVKATPRVRWVVGLFAQKCRGEGPQGLFFGEPAPPCDVDLFLFETCNGEVMPLFALHPNTLPRHIPTPPPRRV